MEAVAEGATDDAMGGAMGGGHKTGPRMLVCYLCGTQHGLSSLAIHQRQCAVKREKAQSALDPASRTAAPSAPDVAVPGSKASMGEVEAYNAAAQAAYNGSMPKCGKCGRTFETAEKLASHSATCKGGGKHGGGGKNGVCDVCRMVYGVWCMMYAVWCMVYDV